MASKMESEAIRFHHRLRAVPVGWLEENEKELHRLSEEVSRLEKEITKIAARNPKEGCCEK